jgi:hypothetical protein
VDVKMGNESGADSALAAAVQIGKFQKATLGADGKYAATHARYMQGERVLAKFDKIEIQGDLAQLSARLKQKAELLKQASDILLDCVSMGVAEWATAALYQVGHTYETFALALRATTPPANLSGDQKEQFQAQLEEFAVPMEEKSIDAYENGWKKAIDLGIFNTWTAKLRESLGRLNPVEFPPFKEIGFDLRSQGPTPMPALLDAPRGRGAK